LTVAQVNSQPQSSKGFVAAHFLSLLLRCGIITLDNSAVTSSPIYLITVLRVSTRPSEGRKGNPMKSEVTPRQKTRKFLFAPLLATMLLAGCGALNPFCGSARPVPVLTSLTPNPATITQVEAGLLLTATGEHFYSSSTILFNGVSLPTTVVSATELQATITTTQISAPGTAQIVVHTPPNLSGDLGCNSGGDSPALTLTVS
jgi:hypothetical protein